MPKITNVGHQTWFVHGEVADILVDPVITRTFGNDSALQFEIWPPREVELDAFRDVEVVALTNEHLDHFHIPSLILLSSFVRQAFVPPLFPKAAEDVLRQLGYEVARGNCTVVEELELEFLSPAAREVPVWESRCASLLITSRPSGTSALIQSDTILPTGEARTVDIFVATNNSQIRPPGWEGLGLSNFLDEPDSVLSHLRQLGSVYSERLAGCRFVTFAGGGYRSIPRLHEPFALADSVVVADLLNESSVEDRFVGLAPGETLHPDGSITKEPWVREAEPLADEPANRPEDGGSNGLLVAPILPHGERSAQVLLQSVEAHSRTLQRMLAASEFGNALVDTNVWLGRHRGADERLGILLLHDDERFMMSFDLAENRFRVSSYEHDLTHAISTYPFGVVAWLSDFEAMVACRLQPWEFFSTAARQWFALDPLLSPAAFFYAALCETVAPEAARIVYEGVLAKQVATR